ncbi:MAG TPA: hypothetical protein G4O08_04405 [Anaerolineae bacterium]|nr:hypothetical protein [Anaerolineae bacterium]
MSSKRLSPLRKLTRILGWTRSSYFLMSTFFATIVLIGIVWWPMVADYVDWYDPNYPILLQFDWLLLGIFAAMSLLIMAGADLKADFWIVLVGLVGGLVIESWGTQTNLWFYFTRERPPLWIIPAWPIASLSIDRMVRMLDGLIGDRTWLTKFNKRAYWVVFPLFLALMLYFVWPTRDKSLTVMALILCFFLILTPTNIRMALLNFAAGSGLGYFLELWGTTRRCWTYYTYQTPPLFAVLAHGMAAVAFWRVAELVTVFRPHLKRLLLRPQTD